MTDERKNKSWIGVDLDGTLAHYDHYRGDEYIGEPITPMVDRVKQFIKEGKDVRLFTARQPHPAIRRWMTKHLGVILPITNVKDQYMQALYDDRAIGVERNTGELYSTENEDILTREEK